MKLCCPFCGTWTVPFVAETWTAPEDSAWAHGPRELIAGRCGRCQSLVLADPSKAAIQTAAARVAVASGARDAS